MELKSRGEVKIAGALQRHLHVLRTRIHTLHTSSERKPDTKGKIVRRGPSSLAIRLQSRFTCSKHRRRR